MAIVLEISGMLGITCLTLAFCHQKLEQSTGSQVDRILSWQTNPSNKMLMLEKKQSSLRNATFLSMFHLFLKVKDAEQISKCCDEVQSWLP